MGLRKNILLKRTVVLSMVLFGIFITSGIIIIFRSSIKRDERHVNVVTAMGSIQNNILRSRIILEDILLEKSNEIFGLQASLDSVRADFRSIEKLFKKKGSLVKKDDLAIFNHQYYHSLGDLDDLSVSITYLSEGMAVPDTLLLNNFNRFERSFKEFQNHLPQYLFSETVRFKQEIIGIVAFNFLIVLLAGFLILRLTTQLIQADRALIHKTLEVENRERERIAADLHDGLGALLSGLIIHIQVLEKESGDNPLLKEKLQHLNYMAKHAIQSIEEVINNLNPSILSRYGLIQSLEKITERLNNLGKTRFVVDANNLNLAMPGGLELTFYRICTELINNAMKHASATLVEMVFFNHRNTIHFLYRDNGVGFNYGINELEDQKSGLLNLVRRVESMEGSHKITSKPGEGVKIEVIFDIANF